MFITLQLISEKLRQVTKIRTLLSMFIVFSSKLVQSISPL